MIVVRLAGGLGNQMFEYAFGRRLAYESNLPLKLDAVFGFQNDPYDRKYALGCFAIQADLAERKQIPFYGKHGRVVRHLGFIFQSLLPRSMRSLIREKEAFVFDPDVLCITRPSYVIGSWQCEQYFEPIADFIRQEFRFRDPISHRAQSLAKELQSDGAVSIHVRRLHGISATGRRIPIAVKRHGVCSLEYFQRAVEVVLQRVKRPRFFVFSDDLAWCKGNLDFHAPIQFVEDEGIRSDGDELNLMSMCQHHIISNSSFSWWGAWLSKKPGKIVVAPARWMQGMVYQPRDLFPLNWIVV